MRFTNEHLLHEFFSHTFEHIDREPWTEHVGEINLLYCLFTLADNQIGIYYIYDVVVSNETVNNQNWQISLELTRFRTLSKQPITRFG